VADLERRLGGRVLHHQVTDIDYVRDIMVLDVRCQAPHAQQDAEQGVTEQITVVRP
jgi:hypothetical protein